MLLYFIISVHSLYMAHYAPPRVITTVFNENDYENDDTYETDTRYIKKVVIM